MFQIKQKNIFSNFYFYFFPSSDLDILRKKSVNQVLKKIRPKDSCQAVAIKCVFLFPVTFHYAHSLRQIKNDFCHLILKEVAT